MGNNCVYFTIGHGEKNREFRKWAVVRNFFFILGKKNGEFWVNIADTNSEFHHSVAKENRNFVQQSREVS